MKKLIFALLVTGLTGMFVACKKDTTALIDQIASSSLKTQVQTSDIPAAITTFVEDNYLPSGINRAFRAGELGWEIEMTDATSLYFDKNEKCLGDDVTLSEARGHGGGGHGGDGDGDGHGGHGGPDGHGGHGGPHHGSCACGDTLAIDSLPQVALDYVIANYPTDTIILVTQKHNDGYAVSLSSGIVLLFGADGVFVNICDGQDGDHDGNWHGGTPVDISALPAAITDYITNNYPGVTIEGAVQRNDGDYFIRLSNHVKLIFDADGNILFVDEH